MKDKKLSSHWKDPNQEKPEVPDVGGPIPVVNENTDVGGKYYGVDLDSEDLLCLEINCKSGQDLGIPYAPTPWSEFIPDEEGLNLHIMDFEYEVVIKGRGLKHLKKFIRQRKLAWIKESLSNKDDGEGDVFINEIQILRRKS